MAPVEEHKSDTLRALEAVPEVIGKMALEALGQGALHPLGELIRAVARGLASVGRSDGLDHGRMGRRAGV